MVYRSQLRSVVSCKDDGERIVVVEPVSNLENLRAERKYLLEAIGVYNHFAELMLFRFQHIDEFICGGSVEIAG
jgi:hypothetical protein